MISEAGSGEFACSKSAGTIPEQSQRYLTDVTGNSEPNDGRVIIEPPYLTWLMFTKPFNGPGI